MKSYGTVRFSPAGEVYDDEFFGRTRRQRDAWIVACEPFAAEKLKRWFKQIAANREGELTVTATREASKDLLWMLDRFPMDVDDASMTRLRAIAAEYDETQATVLRILGGERLETEAGWNEPAVEPYDFQRTASDLVLALGRLLIMDEVGLGKTFTALLTLRDPEALPAVVVCDTHVQRQWLRQLAKFFPMLRGHIIRQRKVYDPSDRRDMKGHHPDVLICSYAKVEAWCEHLRDQIQTLILDETQALRTGHGSAKFHGCSRLADAARYVVGTTATAVYGYGGEIHPIADTLERDVLGTRAEFIRAWGKEIRNGKIAVEDPRALGLYLRDEVQLVIRRTRVDVKRELPEVVRIPHDVDGDQAVLDRELAESGTFDLAELIVSGAGTQHERFLARGDIDWQMRRATGLAKAPYVAGFVDMVLESEDKVLLVGWHRDVYAIWTDLLAHHNPVMYTGSESAAKKDRMAQQFISDPDCRVMVMSVRSGAGLDGLQEACKVVVFGELDWSPPMHDQVIGRLNRDGMDTSEPVVAYFLTCDFGSDPHVMEVLGVKRGQSAPLHDPDIKLFDQPAPDAADRVRKLAEAALERRKKARAAAA